MINLFINSNELNTFIRRKRRENTNFNIYIHVNLNLLHKIILIHKARRMQRYIQWGEERGGEICESIEFWSLVKDITWDLWDLISGSEGMNNAEIVIIDTNWYYKWRRWRRSVTIRFEIGIRWRNGTIKPNLKEDFGEENGGRR